MDTSTLIWIIVGVIVVAIIVVIAVVMSRRNSAKKLAAQHAKAEDLREDARRTEMAAREREAQAAQARADSATAAAEAEQGEGPCSPGRHRGRAGGRNDRRPPDGCRRPARRAGREAAQG